MEALELELTPTPRAVAEARAAVTRGFSGLPRSALDDLRLLVSELVSNAVIHGDLGPDETIRVRVAAGDGCVRAEVIDGEREARIQPRPLDPHTPGGFGLHLVEQLSERWGVRHGQANCVWFELTPDVHATR